MNRKKIMRRLPLICFAISLLMFVLSMAGNSDVSDIGKVADTTGQRLVKRMELMDSYISKVLDAETDQWPDIGKVPEDIVIYRYVNDSLLSWNNQFSVINDDISSKLVFQRMTDLRNRIISPLSEIKEDVAYTNIGPKWYVTKAVHGSKNDKIIAGIEIKNTLIDDIRRNENGVNPILRLPARYSVLPLSYSGGADVSLDGVPLFKVIADNGLTTPFLSHSILKWLALLFIAFAMILLLQSHRTFKVYMVVTLTLTALMALS